MALVSAPVRALTKTPRHRVYLRKWADRSAFNFVCGLPGSSGLSGLFCWL